MANTLPVSRLVNATINLTPNAAQSQNISTLLILGSSAVIDTVSRFRSYGTIAAVATDFGTAAPEYLTASLWFQQSPQPSTLMIGRWAKTASAGQLLGGTLSGAQQALTNFTAVLSGGMNITVDGVLKTLTAINLSAITNLNGVASAITTALASAGTCVWNSTFGRFEITSATTGAGVSATGSITFSGIPANNDTVTIGGTVVTFVTAGPTGNQVLIGASASATAANLQAFLLASADVNIVKAAYSTVAAVTTVTYASVGTPGNAFTLAKTSTNIAVSGATLSGGVNASSVSFATAPGSGTDISGLMGLTAAFSGAYVANGIAAESAVASVTLFDSNFSQQWYAVTIPTAADSDHLAVAAYIEAANTKHVYGVSTQEAGVLVATDTSNIAYQLKALKYKRTFTQFSSSNAYSVASLLGRILTTDYTANKTVITLMYKQEPGIVAENLNVTQINALEGFNCNVFVAYDNSTAIIEPGMAASGDFIDTITGTDWLSINIQTSVFNLLYTSTTKIPQTDGGNHLIATTIEQVCAQGVRNGLGAPGTWNSGGFGTLKQGDFLPKGFYVYAPPISSQSQSDRAARKSVPFQVAFKLAGAVHYVAVAVTVNQ